MHLFIYSMVHSYFSKHLLSLYILVIRVMMVAFIEHLLSIKRLQNAKMLVSGMDETTAHHDNLRSKGACRQLWGPILCTYPTLSAWRRS